MEGCCCGDACGEGEGGSGEEFHCCPCWAAAPLRLSFCIQWALSSILLVRGSRWEESLLGGGWAGAG